MSGVELIVVIVAGMALIPLAFSVRGAVRGRRRRELMVLRFK